MKGSHGVAAFDAAYQIAAPARDGIDRVEDQRVVGILRQVQDDYP